MDRCKRLVSSTVNALKSIRTGQFFNEIFQTCIEFGKKHLLTIPSALRSRKVPTRFKDFVKAQKPFIDEETRYEELFNSIIDSIIDNIESRLATENLTPLVLMESIFKCTSTKDDRSNLKDY